MSKVLALSALAIVGAGAVALACPFCDPIGQKTFSDELEQSDAVIIATLSRAPQAPSGNSTTLERAKFDIVEIIKGDRHLSKTTSIELPYFGEGKIGSRFLLFGVDPPKLLWSTPTLLSDKSEKYIKHVFKLPKDSLPRLQFYQDYLEDPDEMLARDAYDEFARAPYEQVIALKEHMRRDQLVAWIKDQDVPAGRRRLYLTMLGVCGDQNDADMLEGMLRAEDRKMKSGLDALIACYLTLRKEQGLPLIEELFIKNQKCEYADTYSAIMALRFHGQETDVIPRKRVIQSLHHMLDRPDLADLVIVDLARWEDWSVMERLVDLYKKADEKSAWVRVPVVRYLLVCPLPEAQAHLKECEKIDAGAVRRAKTFYPAGDAAEREQKTS
jgi:hypothetical protein